MGSTLSRTDTGRWSIRNGISKDGSADGKSSDRDVTPEPHVPPWKFWRRFSTRRSERKAREKQGIIKTTIVRSPSLNSPPTGDSGSLLPRDVSSDLPDVVDKTNLRRSNSLKPPPKPPRLYLFRSSSINTPRNSVIETPGRDSRNSFQLFTGLAKDDDHFRFPLSGLDNITSSIKENPEMTTTESVVIKGLTPEKHVDKTPPDIKEETIGFLSSNRNSHMRIKIVTPDLTLKRHATDTRSRRKSGDRSERKSITHRAILQSVSELLCQTLQPAKLLNLLYEGNVITSEDLEAFTGHPDRRLICESLINTMVRGEYPQFLSFCDILRNADRNREVSDILDAMKDIHSLLNDIKCNHDDETNVFADEKAVSFDVGYFDNATGKLRPIVELYKTKGDRLSLRERTLQRRNRLSQHIESDPSTDASLRGAARVTVCISGYCLSGARANALGDLIKRHECILELRVGKTQLNGDDVRQLVEPLHFSGGITSLDVRLNHLGNEGAMEMAKMLEQSVHLRQLNLSSCAFDGVGCRHLGNALKTNTVLKDLDLSFVDIGDEGCLYLAEMLRKNNCLRKLRLRSDSITAIGCEALLDALKENHTLQELDLSRNFIGDNGCAFIASYLESSPFLSDISLENCGLTSECCRSLSSALLSNKTLRHLDLSVNFIGDNGVLKLCGALDNNTSLETLGLNMCGITNDGFSRLLDLLLVSPSISLLKLCYNRLGRQQSSPGPSSTDLRYKLRIVTSSKPYLKILLWGNAFEEI